MPDLIDDGTWREAALARMSEVFVTNGGPSPHVFADGERAPLRHRLHRASPGDRARRRARQRTRLKERARLYPRAAQQDNGDKTDTSRPARRPPTPQRMTPQRTPSPRLVEQTPTAPVTTKKNGGSDCFRSLAKLEVGLFHTTTKRHATGAASGGLRWLHA
jgi:hypothetical protein